MIQEIVIDERVINPKYKGLLDIKNRYVYLYGGAGAGKSYAIAQNYVLKILSRANVNILVLRKVYADIERSVFNLFKQVITRMGLEEYFEFRTRPFKIVCLRNGNEIIFSGAMDIEQLKSITASRGEITDAWLEEATEFLESDFRQIDIRLRGGKTPKQIICSFNPVNEMHWLKKKTEEERAYVLHTTCEDNLMIEQEYKDTLKSYKVIDPYHYKVYYLGEWGTTGSSYFGNTLIMARYNYVKAYVKPLVEEKNRTYSYVEIQEPIPNKRYVIGVDTAGEGTDNNVATVLNDKGIQVATLVVKQDELLFCDKLEELGYRYNYALIGAEINFSTYLVNELKRRGYTNQYIRLRQDKIRATSSKAYGFRTDKNTRPLMLMLLKEKIQTDIGIINDLDTLKEMQLFIINENGRPEAEVGAHDDRVIALAIGYFIVKELLENKQEQEPIKAKKKGTFDDIFESLENEDRQETYEYGEAIYII